MAGADAGRLDLTNSLIPLHLTYVKRWGIAPMRREQSVAEHTFRVVIIARALCWALQRSDIVGVVTGIALAHDADEVMTGDMPGPGKKVQWPKLDEMHRIVKVADAIETGTWWVLWGHREAWGDHPYNSAPARDISKVMHYTEGDAELRQAAQIIWRNITGREMETYERE